MKNNLKGMLIGLGIGIMLIISYATYYSMDSHYPFFGDNADSYVGSSFILLISIILGYMVGSGIKEK